MLRLARGSLLVVALSTAPALARAEPSVSLGAGGSLLVGYHIGGIVDAHAAWWLGRSWAIALRGGVGRLGLLDPVGSREHDTFVAELGAGPTFRRCSPRICRGLSTLVAFQRHRASYMDGLEAEVPWTERRDSLFVEARVFAQLLLHTSGHLSVDASLGLRAHRLLSYQIDAVIDDRADETYWGGGVASLGVSGHF